MYYCTVQHFLIMTAKCVLARTLYTFGNSKSCLVTLTVIVIAVCCNSLQIPQDGEIVVIDNDFRPRHVYHLEDFFWTGSGDGTSDIDGEWERSPSAPAVPTVFYTTTVVSTMLIGTTTTYTVHQPPEGGSIDSNCVTDCIDTQQHPGVSSEGVDISPTPTYPGNGTYDVGVRYKTPNRRYWLLTILQSEPDSEPVLPELESRLANLYQIAFFRQQERHLGIDRNVSVKPFSDDNDTSFGQTFTNRSRRAALHVLTPPPSATASAARREPVQVQIHNVSRRIGVATDNNDEVELVYSVHVAGQPVPATTAAEDMKLVSEEEVVTALGYGILTKAEPYLKESKPMSLSRSQNTWIFVGAALAVTCVLLLLLLLLIIGIKRKGSSKLIDSHQQIASSETDVSIAGGGHANLGFHHHTEDAQVQTCRIPSFMATTSITRPFVRKLQPTTRDSSDSTSTTTTSSSEPSPNTSLAKSRELIQWKQEQEAIKDSNFKDQDSDIVDATNHAIRKSNDIKSANSYLSMPSVKCFPRGSIPEPLSRVLEPVSVRHLDEGILTPCDSPEKSSKQILVRHGSIEAQDPGVIGPLVWNQHCQRLQHAVSVDDEETNAAPNIGRMRKRFQELLDDAFSLFGSRSVSPAHDESSSTPPQPSRTFDSRIHSAYPRLSSDNETPTRSHKSFQRPRTSDPRRAATPGMDAPRRAWGSGAPSPLIRPLSAGPISHRPTLAPHVCPTRILADNALPKQDPAVQVITAIKSEIEQLGKINK